MLSVSWSWCRTSPRAYPSPGYGNQKWGGSFSSSCVRSTWHTEHGYFPIAIARNAAPSPAARLPVPTRHFPGASAVPCHPCGLPLAPGLGLGVSHPCWHPLEPPRQATEGEAHTFLRGAIGRRPASAVAGAARSVRASGCVRISTACTVLTHASSEGWASWASRRSRNTFFLIIPQRIIPND